MGAEGEGEDREEEAGREVEAEEAGGRGESAKWTC